MVKALRLLCCLLFVVTPAQLFSQVFPAENSKLNYRLIGFSFPAIGKSSSYQVEVAVGKFQTADSFNKKVFLSKNSVSNKVILEVPEFGQQYTWRVTGRSGKMMTGTSELHYFSTDIIPAVDPAVTRFRVLQQVTKHEDAMVFVDGTRALYDMKGSPVWFLPDIDGNMSPPADIKLSPQGTITCILKQQAYELDYNGNILWKAPNSGVVSGDTTEYYHHEFTRLSTGDYMVLGNEYIYGNRPMPPAHRPMALPAGAPKPDSNLRPRARIPYGTLIEYDGKGNIVWSWKSSQYFKGSDIENFRPASGRFTDPHENSFFFDEPHHNIYLSCRNISRIVKISYPDGRILANYGEIFKPGVTEAGNRMFCGQHSCRISQKGYLYLYDNNVCDTASTPKVVVLREPASDTGSLKVVWQYQCIVEGNGPKRFDGGGNVEELSDGSMFVSMNRPYSKIFIVSPDKETIWSGIPEKISDSGSGWDMVPVYRASIIENRKDLERLIWHR